MRRKLTFGQWLGLRSTEYFVIVGLLALFGGEGTLTEVLKAAIVIYLIVRALVLFRILK